MLNNELIKKIEDFVYSRPRSVDEIAKHINKNWRTADRYISEIEKNFGTISTRVFREGTRGALKIVFWSSVEKVSHSVFQQIIEKDILSAKRKYHFSPFDIFQYVNNKNKEAYIEKNAAQKERNLSHYAKFIKAAEKQVIIFSGNLSFINERKKEFDFLEIFEELVKKSVQIKVICRVDLAGKDNVEKLLYLNFKHGKEMIEIRHHEQPLRGAIIDNKTMRLKEVNIPFDKSSKSESSNVADVVYFIKDKEWADWLSKIFWKMFSSSIEASVRLKEMQKIRDIK